MRNLRTFLRSFYISSVVVFCLILGFVGVTKAYENIRLIAYGEYKNAIEIENGKLRIFDFYL